MNFFESIQICFKKYFDSMGRASRSEFWYFTLFCIIANFIAITLSAILQGMTFDDVLNDESNFLGIIDMIVYFILLIPMFTVTWRRMHDINRSGWWILITITIIGILLLLYWYCKKGDEGENKFGNNPLKS